MADSRPLAVDDQGLAEFLQVSRSHVRELDRSGWLPRPVKLGGSARWVVSEVEDWLLAGAPPRADWEAMKERRIEHPSGITG